MQKIGKLIKHNLQEHKIEDKVKAYEVYKLWEKVLTDFLPAASNQTMVTAFNRGTLEVAVLQSDLSDEINLCQQRIIYQLNNLLGKNLVYSIRCQS
jgi:hypothetical protein